MRLITRRYSARPKIAEKRGDLTPRAQLSQLRRLLGLLRPYRRSLMLAAFGVVAAATMGLVFPRIMGSLVDTSLATHGTTDNLDRIALILLLVFLGQAGFNYLRMYTLAVAGEGVVADLRRNVYDRIIRLPVHFFDARHTGEITSRLTADATVVQTTVSGSVGQALSQLISLLGGATLMIVLSPVLSLSLLTFLPLIIISAGIFGRRLNRISTSFQDQIATANAFADESIASIRVVKWFNAEPEVVKRYGAAIRSSYSIALRRARLRAMFVPSVTFVAFGTLAIVLWIGGRQVLEGQMTAGDLVSFLLYALSVAGAIGAFSGIYSQLQEALGASRRIFELLGEPIELPVLTTPTHISCRKGSIRFDDVHFAYPGRDVEVLNGINMEINPGEMIAVVGPSGAGKSTLTQLICRFYDATQGTVLIDGVDVREQDLQALRGHMAAVPQNTQLFSGTISENLRVARSDATEEQLREAALAANAIEFIEGFPDRFETIVGDRGIQLSGGQRQRIAIARAVLADPKILILDEATTYLDARSEALVQEALDRLMAGRTTLVIAHRLSTVRAADRIIVMVDGQIMEEGTHFELTAADGLYAQLSAQQLA